MSINWKEMDDLLAAARTVKQQEEDEVKFVSYNLSSTKHRKVELMHLTDLQIGSKAFQRKRFIEYRNWLLSEPQRYVFLGGDIIDAATVMSIASPYENTKEPSYQVDEAVGLLAPLARAGRLLGYVGGNHERRTAKTWGDAGRNIAKDLKVPYSRGVQLIDINYGGHRPFKVSLWHGSGGARTKGAKAQMLHRFMSQADSQVYLVGHLHDSILLFDWRQERLGNKIKLRKIAGVMSSSFQGYWNSYAETYAMSPSDTMMALIVLEPNGHWGVSLK